VTVYQNGIDKDIHNDVTNCNERTSVLDGNANLHRNVINSNMNTINSPTQECDHRKKKLCISFAFYGCDTQQSLN
jgi:hypothetical protein